MVQESDVCPPVRKITTIIIEDRFKICNREALQLARRVATMPALNPFFEAPEPDGSLQIIYGDEVISPASRGSKREPQKFPKSVVTN